MKTVPRIGRVLDLVGLLIFVGGGATYAWAWLGFRRLRAGELQIDPAIRTAVSVADGFWRLQKIGTVLMVAGVAVFIVAWQVARASARRAPDPPEPPAP